MKESPNWGRRGPEQRSAAPSPFPTADPSRRTSAWLDEETPAAPRHPGHLEFRSADEEALASPREVLERVRSSPALGRWLVACIAAIVAGLGAYLTLRPDPPNREDAISAVRSATDRWGTPISFEQAECIVADLEAENISYAELMSPSNPSPELTRAIANAFARCPTPVEP